MGKMSEMNKKTMKQRCRDQKTEVPNNKKNNNARDSSQDGDVRGKNLKGISKGR